MQRILSFGVLMVGTWKKTKAASEWGLRFNCQWDRCAMEAKFGLFALGSDGSDAIPSQYTRFYCWRSPWIRINHCFSYNQTAVYKTTNNNCSLRPHFFVSCGDSNLIRVHNHCIINHLIFLFYLSIITFLRSK